MWIFHDPRITKFERQVATSLHAVTKITELEATIYFLKFTAETKTRVFVPKWTSLDNFGLAGI